MKQHASHETCRVIDLIIMIISMTTAKRSKRAPRIDFDVTAEHMAAAIPKDSGHCMIADALMDAYPHVTNVAVDLATIRFSDPTVGRRYVYLTPLRAQHALLNFDAGIVSEPFHVRQNAAQVIETQSASRKRRARGEKKPIPGKPTLVAPEGGNAESVPVRIGGQLPPIGPLAGGPGAQRELAKEDKKLAAAAAADPKGAAAAKRKRAKGEKLPPNSEFRTGRRREFGIRLMGR